MLNQVKTAFSPTAGVRYSGVGAVAGSGRKQVLAGKCSAAGMAIRKVQWKAGNQYRRLHASRQAQSQ